MIRPEAAITAYRAALGAFEVVLLQRRSVPEISAPCAARVMDYAPAELVGLVGQGDRRLIVMAQDLDTAGFPRPLRLQDTVVVRGQHMAISAIDDSTRRLGGLLIAYELRVRGH